MKRKSFKTRNPKRANLRNRTLSRKNARKAKKFRMFG